MWLYGYIPVPNVIQELDEFVECIRTAGIALTGGNSLASYGGNAPERDDTDRRLVTIALDKKFLYMDSAGECSRYLIISGAGW